MSRIHPVVHWFSAVSLLTGLYVGCGGERTELASSEVSEEEKSGGLAAICSEAAVESLNPFISPDLVAGDLRVLLFTPLVLYGEGGEFRPYLATDWTWEDNHTRLTLRIRGDMEWHDGTPLTAEDVAWTISAAADPGYAYLEGADFESFEGAFVRDSVTLELRFGEPLVAGLEPFVALPILPRHLLEDIPRANFQRAEYHRSPVGSGPFELAERRGDGSLVFERFDGFPTELGRPYLDRIVLRAIPEPATLVAELESGAADLCLTGSAVGERFAGSGRVEVHSVEPIGIQTIFLDTREGPLGEVKVRRALSAALRRSDIAAVVSPMASPAGNPLSPASPWVGAALVQPDDDAAAAAALLDEAGWSLNGGDVRADAQGRELRLKLVAPQQLEPSMTVVQAQLARIGVAVDLSFMEFASFVETILNPDTRPDAMALGLYESKLVHPGLHSILHSTGYQNLSSYSDPDMDAALERLGTVLSPEELASAYVDIQRGVASDIPMIYTIYVPRLMAVGSRIQGVRVDLNGPFASVSEWWIHPGNRRFAE